MSQEDVAARLTRYVPLFSKWLKGDVAAVSMCLELFRTLHVWDDLIDKDKDVPDEEIHGVFWSVLFMLPQNPFYQKHFNTVNALMMNAVINWKTANQFERGTDEHEKTIAFILRGSYLDLLTMSAALIGGPQWAEEVGPEIRHWAHEETYAEYLANLAKETAARDERLARKEQPE